MTELIEPKQLQAMLGLSRRTLYRYEKSGHLHPIKLNSRTVRYSAQDVEAMLEKFRCG